jgi:hypothetical protein
MNIDDVNALSSVDQAVAQALAQQRTDPNVPLPRALDLDDAIADALTALCRDQSISNYIGVALSDQAEALVKRWVRILSAAKVFPDPSHQNQDMAWAPWRCAFAAFGYAAHALVVREIQTCQPHCPWETDETANDWLRSAIDARHQSGWPLTMARLPWEPTAAAFGSTAGMPQAPDKWLVALAALHLARYARRGTRDGRSTLALRPGTQDFRFLVGEAETPITTGIARSLSGVYSVLKIQPAAKTKAGGYHRPSEAMLFILKHITLKVLDPLIAVTQVPRPWVLGPHPRLVGCAMEPGLTPVSLKLDNVWRMNMVAAPNQPVMVKIEPLETCLEALDYDWPTEAADSTDDAFTAVLPPTLNDFELPFDRICSVFHNVESPVPDAGAYRAALNATLLSPFLKDCREFPPIYLCPQVPTDDGATNTGKSTLAKALACVYSPALNGVGTVKVGSEGAPSARVILSLLERHGTAAFDEFVLSKDPDHPLSETKILNLATGDAVSFGKVMSNDGALVRLAAPLFISSKVVRGKVDMFNRSLRIELGQLASTMNHETYAQVQDGTWSFETALHARAIALLYGASVEQAKLAIPYPPKHWRFHTLRALASLLLSRDENLTLADASVRIDNMIDQMVSRHTDMLSKSMDTGLSASAVESGSVLLGYQHLFSEDMMNDDVFVLAQSLGARPVRDYLKLAADAVAMTPARLVGETYGKDFAGTERQLVLALNRSLVSAMPNIGDYVPLPGQRGTDGWIVVRLPDYGNRMRIEIKHIVTAKAEAAKDGRADGTVLDLPDGSSITTPDTPPKE